MKLRCGVGYGVSQVALIDCGDVPLEDAIEIAKELALDEIEYPNSSNKFEMDSDMEPMWVCDENGEELWRREDDAEVIAARLRKIEAAVADWGRGTMVEQAFAGRLKELLNG